MRATNQPMPTPHYKTSDSNKYTFLRFFVALVVCAALVFVSGASVKAAWGMYQTFDMATAEQEIAEAELGVLKAEHAAMAATLERFNTERGIETALRERFGVVRPGEGEIRIVRDKGKETIGTEEDSNPFSRLFHALFAW